MEKRKANGPLSLTQVILCKRLNGCNSELFEEKLSNAQRYSFYLFLQSESID